MNIIGVRVEFVCVQCALKKLVEALDAGREPGAPEHFEGTMEDHVKAAHPDAEATLRERAELLKRLEAHAKPQRDQVEQARARARTAHLN